MTNKIYPAEVQSFIDTMRVRETPVEVGEIERYENIYQIAYRHLKTGSPWRTMYIRVYDENRMSDSKGCG